MLIVALLEGVNSNHLFWQALFQMVQISVEDNCLGLINDHHYHGLPGPLVNNHHNESPPASSQLSSSSSKSL